MTLSDVQREQLAERAWNRAGDLMLDSDLEGDEWCMAREDLASLLLAMLLAQAAQPQNP